MRLCTKCAEPIVQAGWTCPVCGFTPPTYEGFPILAPELLGVSECFEEAFFEPLARAEASSFWFRARNAIILWALEKHLEGRRTLLEIGCGTGFVLSAIRKRFPCLTLTGSEMLLKGLKVSRSRLPEADLLQFDARAIPFIDHFDAIGAFDVIEHITEDEVALGQCHQALRDGGILLLTVPQHPFLWSDVDVFAHHRRRYRKADLLNKIHHAGFDCLKVTSFVTLLLPALLFSRSQGKRRKRPSGAELALPAFLDRLFGWIMDFELGLLRLGLSLPAGGSLLVVARKRRMSQ